MNLIHQAEAVKKSKQRLVENLSRPLSLYGHDTGHHDINLAIGGWIPTKITSIAGRASNGKSALVIQMLEAAQRVSNNRRAEFLMFTWETESSYMVDRYISYKAEVPIRMLTQIAKLLTEEKKELIKSAYREALSLPVTYQQVSLDIERVKKVCDRFYDNCRKKSDIEGVEILPVILVDYIGIADFPNKGSRTNEIRDFMKGMNDIVNKINASGCLLCQINRGADLKEIPEVSDISDSQSIEQGSDNLAILHYPRHYNVDEIKSPYTKEKIFSYKPPGEQGAMYDLMIWRIAKAREGSTGDILVKTDMKFNKFWSYNLPKDFEYHNLYQDEQFWKDHFKI